jgi:hypothetical protein
MIGNGLPDRFDHRRRWLARRRNSSCCPTVRLFRQQRPDGWNPVIADVVGELSAFVGR